MRIGLIGYGYWGTIVARNISRVADLAVVVDPDPVRIAEASTVWGAWGTRVATEPDVAFRECDAVWIATPAAMHAESVRQALEHGVHVLCEKPFVLSSAEAEELREMAEEQDLALMVGHLSLCTEAHVRAARTAGAYRIETVRRTSLPSLSDGNVVWGLAPHDVASILNMFGMPDSISANGTEHRTTATLLWADEREAFIEVDWLATERHQSHCVWSGSAKIDVASTPDRQEPLLVEATNFVTLCQSDINREAYRQEALDVTIVLEEIERSRMDSPTPATT